MAPTGMEGFAQQAGALSGQAQGLRAAVDHGQLVMDPESAERVAKVYETKADEVRDALRDARQLVATNAYGDCGIGRGLEQKFVEKAKSDAGVLKILGEMQETLRNMAQHTGILPGICKAPTTRTLATWDGTSDLMVGMRKTRSTAAAVLVAGMLLGGCAGGDSAGDTAPEPEPRPTGPSPLASFDPCAVLSPEELKAHGATEPGEVVDQGIGEPGCSFDGEELLLTIYKAEKFDMAYWEDRRANFDVFESNQVGSRKGIKAVEAGAADVGACRQVIESGGGSVSVDVMYDSDKLAGNDPCAKAMEIAQLVEPKLPE